MTVPHVIALHGGAGVNPERDYSEVETHLAALVRESERRLGQGDSALDVVEYSVAEMEGSGLYVAGRGSAPNDKGVYECDAAIMDGARLRAGGVCALRDIANPVMAARAVLEKTPHLLLGGEGAREFALEQGLAVVDATAEHYRTPIGVEPSEMTQLDTGLAHGTVGAVALDREGYLAAATSTGGLLGKMAGRVGDTPLTGIGNWADDEVAISCTGIGEAFIYAGGARDVISRIRYGGKSLEAAAYEMLGAVAKANGDGGLIAVNRQGVVVTPFNSQGMKRAVAGAMVATTISIC